MASLFEDDVNPTAKHRDLAIISIIAVIYRAAHLLFWSRTPYFATPSLDELYHHVWAKSIAAGSLRLSLPFFRAPLYPYFLGGIYSIFGDGPWPPRIIQGIIGVIGCCLVYLLTHKISGSRRAALFAGIAIALSPMPALFESRLLLDFLLVMLGALVLILFFEAERRRPSFSILTGVAVGAFALARPNILAVFPFMLGWLLWAKSSGVKVRSVGIKAAGFAVFGLILTISPAMIHNLSRGSRALIATQGGLNLYLGNNPQTDGITPVLPGHGGDWTLIEAWRSAERQSGERLDPDAMDRFYRKKAIGWALDNPSASLKLMGRKVLLLLSGIEHGNNGSPEFFKSMSPPLRSPFSWRWLMPVALLLIPLIKWNRRLSLLAVFFAAYSATVVIFFVNARFRLPLIAPLIVFVSIGIFGEKLSESRFRRIFAGMLFVAGLLICAVFPAGKLGARGTAESYFALGNLYLRNGELARADSLFSLAIEKSPEIDRANLNRGIIAFNEGDLPRAIKHFTAEAYLMGGKRELALSNLGVMARISADTAGALEFGARSIADSPFSTAPYINFAQSLLEFGRPDSAIAIALRGLELDSLNLRLLNIAGAAAIEMRDFSRAKVFLRPAIRNNDDGILRLYELASIYSEESAGAESEKAILARIHYNLALAEAEEGQFGSAIDNLWRAVEFAPKFPEAYSSIGTIYEHGGMLDSALICFERAVELGMIRAELYYNIGLVLAQLERYGEAYLSFKEALALDSLFTPASEKIELLEKLSEEDKISIE